jgi:hypothetical protein
MIGQKYDAQNALKAFEDGLKTRDFVVNPLTQEEGLQFLVLRAMAAKEVEDNSKVASDYQAELNQAQLDYENAVSVIRTKYGI